MGLWDYVFFGLMFVILMSTLKSIVSMWKFGGHGNRRKPGKNSIDFDQKIHSLIQEINERQKKLENEISELRTHNQNIERILREVE